MIHSYVIAFAWNVCKTSLFKTIVFSIRDMKFLADITESEPNKRLKSENKVSDISENADDEVDDKNSSPLHNYSTFVYSKLL